MASFRNRMIFDAAFRLKIGTKPPTERPPLLGDCSAGSGATPNRVGVGAAGGLEEGRLFHVERRGGSHRLSRCSLFREAAPVPIAAALIPAAAFR